MTNLLARLAAAAVFSASAAQAQTWELVWEDNFDGFVLDTTKWEPMIGTGTNYGLPAGWGNNEDQYYTDRTENVRVVAGTLQITARRENFAGSSYTSARLRTLGMGEFLYGRFEARIQIPDATGVWPAFWMLPTNSPYGGWASSGEIDIMESTNAADRIYGTIHYGAPWPSNVSSGGSTTMGGTDFGAGYHVYAIEWEPDVIRWFIDDFQYGSLTSATWYSTSGAAAGNDQAPFDVPFHLLLNVAVGGDFPGDPVASDYPVTMFVDYVRVYSTAQSAFGGVPAPVPGRVEAEDFDEGTQGQAYNDCDASNNGGAYRSTGVDLQACSEGGFNIGWMCDGEWTEYTVDVAEAGEYEVTARVASNATGGSFRFEVDGAAVTPTVSFPATGGWQTWTDVTTTATLAAGEQVIRFANAGTGQSYNVNRFDFVLVSVPCPVDLNGDGSLNLDDVSLFAAGFFTSDPAVDLNSDGAWNLDDVTIFTAGFAAGCP